MPLDHDDTGLHSLAELVDEIAGAAVWPHDIGGVLAEALTVDGRSMSAGEASLCLALRHWVWDVGRGWEITSKSLAANGLPVVGSNDWDFIDAVAAESNSPRVRSILGDLIWEQKAGPDFVGAAWMSFDAHNERVDDATEQGVNRQQSFHRSLHLARLLRDRDRIRAATKSGVGLAAAFLALDEPAVNQVITIVEDLASSDGVSGFEDLLDSINKCWTHPEQLERVGRLRLRDGVLGDQAFDAAIQAYRRTAETATEPIQSWAFLMKARELATTHAHPDRQALAVELQSVELDEAGLTIGSASILPDRPTSILASTGLKPGGYKLDHIFGYQ